MVKPTGSVKKWMTIRSLPLIALNVFHCGMISINSLAVVISRKKHWADPHSRG